MIGTRRITRRSFLAAAGLAAVGASLSLTGCSGSVSDGLSSKHLLVAHSHSEAHPVNVGLQKMTEVASAESDLTFSVYPNGQLGDNAAMIQLVKAGVLDIAKVSASSMEQFNSAYAIFSMPYVFESTEQYFAVMNQSEAVQEIFRHLRSGLLCHRLVRFRLPQHLHHQRRPLRRPRRPEGSEDPHPGQPHVHCHDPCHGRQCNAHVQRRDLHRSAAGHY